MASKVGDHFSGLGEVLKLMKWSLAASSKVSV